MPVERDASGSRYVQSEIEVPGTPEEVWQAIATGPGISSWFVPTTVDGRVGGKTKANFGPGMDSVSTVTTWDPPHRFVAEGKQGMGPDDPSIATEWTVEGRDGGTCVVRVVHRWFSEADDWDDQMIGTTHGWPMFFRVLKGYLAHYRGQAGVPIQVMGAAPEPTAAAWAAYTGALGLAWATVGQRVSTPTEAGVPRLAGTVEWAGQAGGSEELLIRLESPAPGIAQITPHAMGGQVFLATRLFLFGERAAEVAAGETDAWSSWLGERFPMGGDPGESADPVPAASS